MSSRKGEGSKIADFETTVYGVPWKTSLFQLEKKTIIFFQKMFAMYGFHSENIFWEKIKK